MQMPVNAFKQALAGQHTQLGLFLGMGHPVSAEILATCGFDFLLIDAEHGLTDLRGIQAQLQAIAAYPSPCLVRPPNHDASLIKQLLGVGVQTLLMPMVETAEQAQQLVRATRYPPRGIRGVGTGLERGARWNAVSDYFSQADAQTCLVVQIESRTALDNLDAIAQVEGVDAVFLGPSDLAASLGYLGQPGHPEVKQAIETALQRIRQHGKAAGVFCADPALAEGYRKSGASFMALGADTALLRSAALQLLSKVRPQTGTSTAGAGY
ncbi:HpcH/HpaI aldolase/citrate lyase family protein [Pusillimonas sp. CC-YST705]|uniref:HpcH/HpaI aldolase/citrate lyase family protein n=1 Tax=Mesopusillimonas faecipullorum TaxID=2755040 RepID=A0ABS8CCT4_9BURK|nr:HpcH/HpaI aldolase/citrate lyase family protein [Mesopusillimonas faecipullorum]MCB5363828.1 HpcH/HpaI aldolase/citrate lyase family protein [Mesopusillimonas faecipullorum]